MATPNEKEDAKYLDSTIRVVTTFFAALVGFGLKRILDEGIVDSNDPRSVNGGGAILNWLFRNTEVAIVDWLSFILAVLLFLKFIIGSANHLYVEHIKNPPTNAHNVLVILELSSLTTYGIFATAMCYAGTPASFFWLACCLLSAAILWAILDILVRITFARSRAGNWWYFLLLNPVQLTFFGLALHLESYSGRYVPL